MLEWIFAGKPGFLPQTPLNRSPRTQKDMHQMSSHFLKHVLGIGFLFAAALPFSTHAATASDKNPQYRTMMYSDSFLAGLDQWQTEIVGAGNISAKEGVLDVNVPEGASVWFKKELSGPIVVEYEALAVSNGGENDWVSDLNCFWMATDPKRPDNFFSPARTGRFEEYNTLKLYYVGQGGNRNTTTRFRRYIGDANTRPLLTENDKSAPEDMLTPNRWQSIRVVANGPHIQYFRDGKIVFDYYDEAPYTHGYFGFRTTKSHLKFRHFRIYKIDAP